MVVTHGLRKPSFLIGLLGGIIIIVGVTQLSGYSLFRKAQHENKEQRANPYLT